MEERQMIKNILKGAAAFLLAGIMVIGNAAAACAATEAINSVSVKVNAKLEAGSSLPEIEIGSGTPDDGGVRVDAGNSRYYISAAEWLDKGKKELKAADEPQMRVTLEPFDVGKDYFLASYRDSNVKISGGKFVSARRSGNSLIVTVRLNGVKGEYESPADAFWNENNLGEARWEKPSNTSGYYEVQLFRNNKSVYRVPETSAIKYNFYPYMTEKGDYTFKVRTVPKTDLQVKYGKKSGWIESGELQITDRYVSDGKGQQKQNSTTAKGATEPVGWVKENGGWYYRYPNGSLCRGQWEYIEGQWYYFNVDGLMLTGWQTVNDQYYYLYPNGQMAVGWSEIDGKWYYFRTSEEGGIPAGTMISNGFRVIGPYYYYFNADGSMYTGWLSLNNKWYYMNPLDNSLQGAMFTGWIKSDTRTYFTDANGELVTGWWEIDGNWYYFYPDTGEMAVNTLVNGFYVNEDGVWIQ